MARRPLGIRRRRIGTILIQTCQAIASIVGLVVAGLVEVDLTGVFAALTSALLAWSQVRQHEGRTGLCDRGTRPRARRREGAVGRTEQDLSSFVAEAEAIMSRERGAWSARWLRPEEQDAMVPPISSPRLVKASACARRRRHPTHHD